MARCPRCGDSWRELADEQGDHDCPRCGGPDRWRRISSDPLTTEDRVAAVCDDGREGWRSVRWNRWHQPELYGDVTDDDGHRLTGEAE